MSHYKLHNTNQKIQNNCTCHTLAFVYDIYLKFDDERNTTTYQKLTKILVYK